MGDWRAFWFTVGAILVIGFLAARSTMPVGVDAARRNVFAP